MFEGIKGKCLDISKEDYQELKRWDWNEEFYRIVQLIFQTDAYQGLSLEYKKRVHQALRNLQDKKLDIYELDDALKKFWKFFENWAITTSENFYYYLDVLLDYPTFPIMDAYLFAEYPDENDQKLLDYTRIEAKLYYFEEDFKHYREEFEDIVKNEKLRELGLTDVVINGIINTHLPKVELISYISLFLINKNDFSFIFKLFEAPNMSYNYLVNYLLEEKGNIEEGHILEMIDMIYATPKENLEKLRFTIKNKLTYQEMSFWEASRDYHDEAMKILDTSTKPIKSYTRVRVPVYKRRV